MIAVKPIRVTLTCRGNVEATGITFEPPLEIDPSAKALLMAPVVDGLDPIGNAMQYRYPPTNTSLAPLVLPSVAVTITDVFNVTAARRYDMYGK